MKMAAHGNRERGGVLTKLIVLLGFAVVCGLLYLLRGPILSYMGESWVVDDSLEQAEALIVLSDDNFYADRATKAAELFREGKAKLVVASGRRLRPGAGIGELMEHDLIERGVPKESILRVAHNADNTREEAEALLVVATEQKWRKIIVVTSNYHTRRARYIFRKVFPQQVEVSVSSARDSDFDPAHWWEKRKSIKELTRELAGMVVAIWELRHSGETKKVGENVPELAVPNLQDVV
jgi:uncharacterized SAM-binding protein YcdF (DUF218 family)